MFNKKRESKELDVRKLNELMGLAKNFLNIIYVLIIILGLYAIIILIKELQIIGFVLTILSIISPLFIGIIIAWLFDPFVRWLKRKGIKRIFGAIISYLIFISAMFLIVGSLVPLLSEQINEFAKTLPAVFDSLEKWFNSIFDKLSTIENLDTDALKAELFKNLEVFANELPNTLAVITVNILKGFFSFLGVFVVGLVIGFYLLISFDDFSDSFITWVPKRMRNDARDLFNEVNVSLRKFVQGTLMLSTLIFVVSTIGFFIAGLKGALLFGLFCGITNIIPYIGPYIGGAPAVIVAFSQDLTTGIVVLIVIFVVQLLEGNIFQPILMSKTMKLHPVTIMIGLLIFGYYWGIIGMILATPIIAAFKAIFMFFDEKFGILNFER